MQNSLGLPQEEEQQAGMRGNCDGRVLKVLTMTPRTLQKQIHSQPGCTDRCTCLLGASGPNILSGESWTQKEARGLVRSRGKEMAAIRAFFSSTSVMSVPFSVSADALIGRKTKVLLLSVLTPWGPMEN